MGDLIYIRAVPKRTVTEAKARVRLDAFRRGWDPGPWESWVFVLADELGDVAEAERRVLTAMARGEEPPVYARASSPEQAPTRSEEVERRKPKH